MLLRYDPKKSGMGILLDIDTNWSRFVLPNNNNKYEPLNRNHLIAMMGVIYSLS